MEPELAAKITSAATRAPMPGVSEGDAKIIGQTGGLTECQVASAVVNLHTLMFGESTSTG